jgi:hypothetical protein
MLNWLLKIDPTYAFMTAMAIGGWLWRKASGETRDRVSETIQAIVDNIVWELLDAFPDPSALVPVDAYLRSARTYLAERVWKALANHGIKRNKAIEQIVNLAIERGTRALAERVADARAAHQRAQQQKAGS